MKAWNDFLDRENKMDEDLEEWEEGSQVLAAVRLVAASMKQHHKHHSNHFSFPFARDFSLAAQYDESRSPEGLPPLPNYIANHRGPTIQSGCETDFYCGGNAVMAVKVITRETSNQFDGFDYWENEKRVRLEGPMRMGRH